MDEEHAALREEAAAIAEGQQLLESMRLRVPLDLLPPITIEFADGLAARREGVVLTTLRRCARLLTGRDATAREAA